MYNLTFAHHSLTDSNIIFLWKHIQFVSRHKQLPLLYEYRSTQWDSGEKIIFQNKLVCMCVHYFPIWQFCIHRCRIKECHDLPCFKSKVIIIRVRWYKSWSEVEWKIPMSRGKRGRFLWGQRVSFVFCSSLTLSQYGQLIHSLKHYRLYSVQLYKSQSIYESLF